MSLFEVIQQYAEKCAEEKKLASEMSIRDVEHGLKTGPLASRMIKATDYSARLSSSEMEDQEIVSRFKAADNVIAKTLAAKELENRGYLERDSNGKYVQTGKKLPNDFTSL